MAIAGRKPKPAQLRVVDGTHRESRHGPIEEVETATNIGEGSPLKRPSFLKGEARKAWDKYVAPHWWIDETREPAAIMFCELWAEFRHSPLNFQAARLAQLRALQGELGLTDERNRPPPKKADDGTGDFF